MPYKVSKYMDTIKWCEKSRNDDFAGIVAETAYYVWFDSFEAAKQYLIDRNRNKIVLLEKEIKNLKKKLPKLERLSEKPNKEPNDERSVASKA